MDEVFRALADGSRRELLDRLHARNGQTLNELCERLADTGASMTRQAVSKHLAILEGANLVATVRRGREKKSPPYFSGPSNCALAAGGRATVTAMRLSVSSRTPRVLRHIGRLLLIARRISRSAADSGA